MSTLAAQPASSRNDSVFHKERIFLHCPQCRKSIGFLARHDSGTPSGQMHCAGCDFSFEKVRGVWRGLTPEQLAGYSVSPQESEEPSRPNRRGSHHAAFYLTLPFCDLTRRFHGQWKIRERSYRMLEKHILPRLEAGHAGGLRVLDLGAGNGWLSYRLALRNHYPVAIDLSTDPFDGLEASRHYQPVLFHFFPRIQATMDSLPFADAQFDLAIFNASFHYSSDYRRTLQETLRCLTPKGKILIVDSPTYKNFAGGLQMRQELRQQPEQRYDGPLSDSTEGRDFLTHSTIKDLASLGIHWEAFLPKHGMTWAMRPWIAKLKGRHEPSNFYIYLGHVRTA